MAHRTNPLKLGVIGCGRVTETRHLPSLRNLCEAEVVAVADMNPECVTRVANRFRVQKRCVDFVELLNDPEIEAVAICVPAQFHAEIALAALDAEKHVFVEKPLALTLEQADRVIEKASGSSKKVMVGFNLRWHRLVRRAQDQLKQRFLGPIQLVRSVLTSRHEETASDWRKRRDLGGGVLFEMAVHHFDLWRYLLGTEVVEVFATSRSAEWDDEAAIVTARMADGVIATSVFSERTAESDELEIYGLRGRLRISCYDFDGLEYFSSAACSGAVRTRLRRAAHTVRHLPHGINSLWRGGDFVETYKAEWRHFISAVRTGRSVESTLEDGRRSLEVALASVASARLRKSVTLIGAREGPARQEWTFSSKP